MQLKKNDFWKWSWFDPSVYSKSDTFIFWLSWEHFYLLQNLFNQYI